MSDWRKVFGFDGEDLDFESVHHRYREKMITLSAHLELVDIKRLNWALDEARKELGTSGRKFD